MRKLIYTVFTLVIVLLGVLLGATNQQLTELNLLIVRLPLRVVDIAVIFLVVGILLGCLFSMLFTLQRKTKRWLDNSTTNT